ncbi:hypothetical protein Q73_06765 [Bacillus coahuilensis m2-6]|uniref:hypothetical protein n=1 Tax=Bacillus coahuilensis TaxID=408580 RepID=UPI0001850FEF|nr:hypothetical protein [Bacillus coahuilensis]KUP08217.1 hypothetical protein Q73_06765 [Bacillus coahuilensis m2-6]
MYYSIWGWIVPLLQILFVVGVVIIFSPLLIRLRVKTNRVINMVVIGFLLIFLLTLTNQFISRFIGTISEDQIIVTDRGNVIEGSGTYIIQDPFIKTSLDYLTDFSIEEKYVQPIIENGISDLLETDYTIRGQLTPSQIFLLSNEYGDSMIENYFYLEQTIELELEKKLSEVSKEDITEEFVEETFTRQINELNHILGRNIISLTIE